MIAVSTPTTPTPNRSKLPIWQRANWGDYLVYRDKPTAESVRVFFNKGYLLVDMGNEGINHANVTRLFAMLFFIWFGRFADRSASDLGGSVLEKPKKQGAAPDIVLYIGEGVPQWQAGEPRRINLNRWRVPDLVGEISDTTLATDLDEKKHLYAALEIPEYWVIDIRANRVFAFRLAADKTYEEVVTSVALEGLPISVLAQTLERLSQETNIQAANWFSGAIANLNSEESAIAEDEP